MFDSINVDGEEHELWESKEDRDTFGLDGIFVVGITERGPVKGTVSMGPSGVYFSVDDVIFHLDLTNVQHMCSVFAALVEALSNAVVSYMATELKELSKEALPKDQVNELLKILSKNLEEAMSEGEEA